MTQKVANKKELESLDEIRQNRQYWLSRPAEEWLAAVGEQEGELGKVPILFLGKEQVFRFGIR